MATPTPFTRAYDLPTINLAAPHAPGDGQLVLAIGAGQSFGVLSPESPARVMVISRMGFGGPFEVYTIFRATGRTGDTLTGVVAIEGTTDRAYAAGDKLEVRLTAGYINDLNGAVNALEAAMATGGGGGVTPPAVTIGGGSSTDHSSLGFANAALPPYSAAVDGVTPAAAAIQAAYDSRLDDRQGHVGFVATGGAGAGQANAAPGTCWLPEGLYALEQPLWPDGDLVAIKGSGRTTTTLYAKPGVHPIILGPRRRSGWNRAVLDGFAFAGTLTLTTGQVGVVGTGTLFSRELRVGTRFYLLSDGAARTVQVQAIADDTHLTLTAPYAAAGGTGVCVANTPYLATIPLVFAADHRPDAFGVLDNSCAVGGSVMAPGMRWGVTTRSPSSGSIYPGA